MALTTGLDSQAGFAEESEYGTFVVPDEFFYIVSEGITRSAERVEAAGIRPGGLVLHEDDWEEGREAAEGPVELEWPDRGGRFLGKHMLGKVTSSQPDDVGAPNVWEHVCEVFPLDGLSATVQVGRPDTTGTVQPWTYLGAKIAEWELSCEVDGLLMASLTWDVRQEIQTEALAAKSFVASQRKLVWVGGSLTVDAADVPVSSVTFSGTNPIRTDRFFMQGDDSGLKDEPLDGEGLRSYSGSFDGENRPEFATVYEKFLSGAPASVVANFQGKIIEDVYRYGLKIETPSVRIDGETPTVGGPEALERSIPFTVTENGTDPAIRFTITDDQAPPA